MSTLFHPPRIIQEYRLLILFFLHSNSLHLVFQTVINNMCPVTDLTLPLMNVGCMAQKKNVEFNHICYPSPQFLAQFFGNMQYILKLFVALIRHIIDKMVGIELRSLAAADSLNIRSCDDYLWRKCTGCLQVCNRGRRKQTKRKKPLLSKEICDDLKKQVGAPAVWMWSLQA